MPTTRLVETHIINKEDKNFAEITDMMSNARDLYNKGMSVIKRNFCHFNHYKEECAYYKNPNKDDYFAFEKYGFLANDKNTTYNTLNEGIKSTTLVPHGSCYLVETVYEELEKPMGKHSSFVEYFKEIYSSIPKITRAPKRNLKKEIVVTEHLNNIARYVDCNELDQLLNAKDPHTKERLVKEYGKLPAVVAQQTLKLLHQNWKSFFESMKEFKKDPTKFKGMPKPPKYMKEGELSNLEYSQPSSKNGILKFTGLSIKQRFINHKHKLCHVRFVPISNISIKVEIIYEKETKDFVDNGRVAAIDYGVSNIATITFNTGDRPIIINGKHLRNHNAHYNNTIVKKLQSELPKGVHTSDKLTRTINNRNNKMDSEFHKITKSIVDILKEKNITTLAIGHNEGMKQNINIGASNNQTFCLLPMLKMINQLKYKCVLEGMKVIVGEESYTSQASLLDLDDIPVYDKDKRGTYTFSGSVMNSGKNKGRLYKSKGGTIINRDVNGSYNIMRKVVPNSLDVYIKKNGIAGLPITPIRISL